jgi:hypothetical protein
VGHLPRLTADAKREALVRICESLLQSTDHSVSLTAEGGIEVLRRPRAQPKPHLQRDTALDEEQGITRFTGQPTECATKRHERDPALHAIGSDAMVGGIAVDNLK